jgi:hypothetical protein
MSSTRETIYKDDEVWVQCDYVEERTIISLHLDFKSESWSPGFFKKLKALFIKVTDDFRRQGYKEIYGVPLDDDARAKKLARLFGFQEIYKSEYESSRLSVMRISLDRI